MLRKLFFKLNGWLSLLFLLLSNFSLEMKITAPCYLYQEGYKITSTTFIS